MSSTNKSEKLNLNQWLGSDVPCREDFNSDNSIIDGVVGGHISDKVIHINAEERNKWNNQCYLTTYFGNGANSRTITLECTFEPRVLIVFANSYPPSIVNIENDANYNYFGIASIQGSNPGLSIFKKHLVLMQSATPFASTEYRSYNEEGVTYVVIAIR